MISSGPCWVVGLFGTAVLAGAALAEDLLNQPPLWSDRSPFSHQARCLSFLRSTIEARTSFVRPPP